MSIWTAEWNIDEINAARKGTLMEHLDILVTEVGDDYVVATMPVDHRTIQPMGILNGGASMALAESVGSLSAQAAAAAGHYVVGLDINANHLRSAREGRVKGVAKPIHLGRSTQVWEINIYDHQEKLICVCRLTMAVLKLQQA